MPRKIAAARPKRSTVRTGQYYDTRVFDGGTWAARLAAATRFQELVRKQAPGVYAMVVDKRPDGSPTRSGSISVSMVEWPEDEGFSPAIMRHLRSLVFED